MKGPDIDSEKKSVNNPSLVDIFAAFKKKDQEKEKKKEKEKEKEKEMPMKDPKSLVFEKVVEKKEDNKDNEEPELDESSEEVSLPSLPEEEQEQEKDEYKVKDNKESDPKIENIMYGLTYEDYKKKVNVFGSKLKQCGYCLKFFKNEDKGFITKNLQGDEGEMICYHCLFWVNYSEDLRGSVDGLYEKTIHDYIQECSLYHCQDTCTHKGECFVCDYLNGKRITGIFGEEELFLEKNEPSNTDEFVINITI